MGKKGKGKGKGREGVRFEGGQALPCGATVSIGQGESGRYDMIFGRQETSVWVTLSEAELRMVARWAPDDAAAWRASALHWLLCTAAVAAAGITGMRLHAPMAGQEPPPLMHICAPMLTPEDGVALGALAARFLGE